MANTKFSSQDGAVKITSAQVTQDAQIGLANNATTVPTDQTLPWHELSDAVKNGDNSRYVAPQASDAQVAIQAAITAIGTGTIYLGDGTYSFSAAVTVPSGISIVGMMPVHENGNTASYPDVFDAGRTYLAGTKCLGDGTGNYNCFEGNATDAGSPATAFADNTIDSIRIENIYFEGFNCPVKFGAQNVMGPYGSYFLNLWGFDNLGAFEWVNFTHCIFKDIYIYDSNTAGTNFNSGGGIIWRADVDPAVLIPGNSVIEQISNLRRYRLNNGIRFEASSGSTLNEIHATRVQSLNFGQALSTQAATMTGSSADIGVSDITILPVGVPCTFDGSVNGFTANRTYYVISSTAGNVQVSLDPDGSAVTASGATAVNIVTGGHANVTIHGSALGIINSTFDGITLETSTNQVGLSHHGGLSNIISIAGTSGTFTQHVTSRTQTDCTIQAGRSNLTTDFSNDSYDLFFFGKSRGTIAWRNGQGMWDGHILGIQNMAAAINANAGTSATITLSVVPTSTAGKLVLVTGTGASAGVQFTVTNNVPKEVMYVALMPLNAAAAGVVNDIHANSSITANTFTITSVAGLADTTTYEWAYISP